MSLPKPDCSVRVSDCQDIDVINTLDGFSTQPRITVPFTGDIDPATVNSNTIFLVNLGDTLTSSGFGDRVGINQVIWDPATRTLVFESDQLLQRALALPAGRDRRRARRRRQEDQVATAGRRVRHRAAAGTATAPSTAATCAMPMRSVPPPRPQKTVAASLFTTQSISPDLAKINRQIKRTTPAPVDFNIGDHAPGRCAPSFR